jgi:hypothetical protein
VEEEEARVVAVRVVGLVQVAPQAVDPVPAAAALVRHRLRRSRSVTI